VGFLKKKKKKKERKKLIRKQDMSCNAILYMINIFFI